MTYEGGRTMWGVLRHLYAFFVAVPPVGYFLTYWIVRFMTKNKTTAHMRALDVTAVLLLSAVSVLWYNVTGGIGWLAILMLYVLLGAGLALLQWWVRGGFHFRKWLRSLWRLGFIFLVIFYFVLFGIGVMT